MKKVFVVYSKEDEEFRSQLEKHLNRLKQNGLIDFWQDRMLNVGNRTGSRILKELEETDIFIFLVSTDLLASEHIWDKELDVALKRANDPDDNVIILPIILNKCDWERTPIGSFNVIEIDNNKRENDFFQKLAAKIIDKIPVITSINSSKGLSLARKLIRENLKSKDISLDLGNCGLADLSELPELWNCTHLEKLYFSTKYDDYGNNISNNKVAENRILSIPEDIGKLIKLTELNLAENPIGDQGVIVISQKLKKLIALDISYSSICDEGLMQVCLNISRLKILKLGGNNISDKGFQYISNHLSHLESLNLSNNDSIEINITINSNNLTRLKELNLSHCNINDDGLKNLRNLRKLEIINFSWNQITVAGIVSLQNMINLKELYLENNLLDDSGAKYIGKHFRSLQILNLSKNEISNDGASIIGRNLLNLKVLDLSINNITENGVIAIAENLLKLQYLDLSDNKIGDEGADAIGEHLKELENLDLMTNTLSDEGVKSIVLNLPKLNRVNLTDNYMKQIPHSFLEDIDALRNWFKSKKVPSNTIKMILLGNTRAGKSELAHILKENKNKLDTDRTHGMEHWLWETNINKDQTLRINIYDFGGQDYYHATHHLFFTENTLYVVLWHNDLNETTDNEEGQHFDVGFWLGNIRYLLQDKFEKNQANDSTSIWLIQNKADLDTLNPKMLPNSELCYTYGVDPKGVFYLSLLKFKDIKSGWKNEWTYFKNHLIDKLANLAGKVEITETTASIRDKVLPELLSRNYFIVDYTTFFDECNSVLGVKNGTQDDYIYTLKYLNGCGEIILFDDIESLKDKIILDPKRLMNIMYSILSKQAAENKGTIAASNAIQIQKDEDINSEVYDWVIDILTFYNIIFRHPTYTDEYIAPQYLSESPYQKILDDLLPASLVIKYTDFIPMAIIGKFIGHYLKNKNEAKYWKYGAIFYIENCYCMVRMDRDAKKIFIHIDDRKTQGINTPSTKSTTQNKDQKNNFLREFMEFFSLMIKSKIQTNKDDIAHDKTYIQGLELSINDKDFFSIEMMLKDLDHCQGYLPNSAGSYQQIPAIFYFLLHKQKKAPKTIFICYSHADVLHRDELDKHLAALKRNGKVDTFHDGKILPGQKWDEVIKSNLYKSDIVLLLLSVDFMNSTYIWETELKIAKEEGKTIVPVFLRHCDFEGTGIDPIQGVPFFDDKPHPKNISWILSEKFPSVDQAYLKVVERIKNVL